MNKYSKEELESMADLITDYMEANSRCNSEWAESINYGGCDTEDEFGNNYLIKVVML